MFAQRFDPEAFTRKRKLSDDDIDDSHSDVNSDNVSDNDSDDHETSESDADSSDSASDVSDESDGDEITLKGDDQQHDMEIDNDEATAIDTEGQEQYETKHQGIFAKLQKSMQSQPDDSVMHDEPEDLKEIAPMPQPTLPRDERLRTTTANNLNWLTTPIYSTPDKTKPFSEFALSPVILNNLHHDGFNDAFSVQITVLDMLLADIHQNKLKPESNGDLLVNASTGSGKTLSYSIPIVQDLIDRVVPRVRAIILVPTKPLIHQVKATLATLCKGTNLYTMSLKTDISIKDEGHKIKANVPDIIVSTPGRLVEHLINGDIDLKYLKWLVIDEADRLLNQSFQNWCDILIKQLDTLRTSGGYWQWQHRVKKLVFSATLTTDAGKLSMLKFFKPRLVIINEEQELVNEMFSLPRTLNEFNLKYGTAKNSIKPLILSKFLIKTDKLNNILIFTKSNESCMRLTKLLELIFTKLTLSITVQYLNSTNNSTTIRSKILKRFESGDINILVVTDLIARGVDILTITDVVNYDIPKSSREYIHRSGRTARAGNHGNVYNLIFGKGELKWFTKIMKDVSRKKDIDVLEDNYIDDGDDDVYKEALQQLQTIVN